MLWNCGTDLRVCGVDEVIIIDEVDEDNDEACDEICGRFMETRSSPSSYCYNLIAWTSTSCVVPRMTSMYTHHQNGMALSASAPSCPWRVEQRKTE